MNTFSELVLPSNTIMLSIICVAVYNGGMNNHMHAQTVVHVETVLIIRLQ